MDENSAVILFLIIPFFTVLIVVYFFSARLSNCYMCKKQLSVQAGREFIKIDGVNYPICSACLRRGRKKNQHR